MAGTIPGAAGGRRLNMRNRLWGVFVVLAVVAATLVFSAGVFAQGGAKAGAAQAGAAAHDIFGRVEF